LIGEGGGEGTAKVARRPGDQKEWLFLFGDCSGSIDPAASDTLRGCGLDGSGLPA
jgi:hypothetical protein